MAKWHSVKISIFNFSEFTDRCERSVRKRFSTPMVHRYAIRETTAVGPAWKIKAAERRDTGDRVSIKIAKKGNPSLQPYLRREIALTQLLRHPHVLGFVDAFEDDRACYLVTEHAANGELFDLVQSCGAVLPPAAMAFFRGLIYGVHFLHAHSIAHCDLRLENLVLDGAYALKITGLAFANTRPQATHYAAPESLGADACDAKRADVWSCGVILYALLVGRFPFDGVSAKLLKRKIRSGQYRAPECPPEISGLIGRMLEVDPSARISIDAIVGHPAFRIGLPDGYEPPRPLPVRDLKKPFEVGDIDDRTKELFGAFGVSDLRQELVAAESNTTKVLYCMFTNTVMPEELPWPERKEQVSDEFECDKDAGDEGFRAAEQIIALSPYCDCGEVMALLQAGLPRMGFDWFHPTERTLICRRQSDGLTIDFQVLDCLAMEIKATLLRGSWIAFSLTMIGISAVLNE
jgi:serine/threonine protein kinase